MILNRDASDRKITGYRIFGIRSDIRKGKLDIRHFPDIRCIPNFKYKYILLQKYESNTNNTKCDTILTS